MQYRLSRNISIQDLDGTYNAVPAKYLDGHFLIYDRFRDSKYVINATIKYYIDKFSVRKTEEEVLKEVEDEVQCHTKEIKQTCSSFFKFLCKSKILVPDKEIESDIIEVPFYKEGDSIDDHLQVLNVLSNRRYTDVYTVRDQVNGGLYVVKLLNRKKANNESRFEREFSEMEAEYKMLQKTRHIPAINKAYGFKESRDQNAYILLEYIEGKSLSRYVREEAGRLSPADFMHIIEEIINAFSELHKSNIIHGDIHSSNILITKKPDVKIIDLGLSINVEIEENEVIRSGGVYFYMPPERINTSTFNKFSKEPDLSSDVYQVGLLIYQLLYNALPFDGFTWEELAQNIKTNSITYPDASFFNYPVSPSLVNILKKCLNKRRTKRYINASELLADFKKHAFAAGQLAEI